MSARCVSLDHIEFSDFIQGVTIGGRGEFQGFEVRGTAHLGVGFALYANGSLDGTSNTDGNNLDQTPRRMAAAALLRDHSQVFRAGDEMFANATAEDVGSQYGFDTPVIGSFDRTPIKSWDEVDPDAIDRVWLVHQHLSFAELDHRSLTGIFGETLDATRSRRYGRD